MNFVYRFLFIPRKIASLTDTDKLNSRNRVDVGLRLRGADMFEFTWSYSDVSDVLRWLLMSRIVVSKLWYEYFGQGHLKTATPALDPFVVLNSRLHRMMMMSVGFPRILSAAFKTNHTVHTDAQYIMSLKSAYHRPAIWVPFKK